jgi:hypothetical protein
VSQDAILGPWFSRAALIGLSVPGIGVAGVINGWEELESLIIHGFCGIMAAEAAVQAGNMLQTALRDHDG